MRYLKTFEQNINEPEVGDYVICVSAQKADRDFNDFLSKNIGRICKIIISNKKISDTLNMANRAIVEYKDIPYEVKMYFTSPEYGQIHPGFSQTNGTREFSIRSIIKWSKNIEDLEVFLSANKYNL